MIATNLVVTGLEHPIAVGCAVAVVLWILVLARRVWRPERRAQYARLMTLVVSGLIGYDAAFVLAFGFDVPLGPVRALLAFATGVQVVAALAALTRPRVYE